MKNTVYLLLLVILLPMNSCEDFLEQKPLDGLVSSDYWNNKEEVLATLAGAYKKFSVLDTNLFVFGEVRGDMIDENEDRSIPDDTRDLLNGNINASNNYAKWGGFYTVINLCNNIIHIAPKVQDVDPTFTDFLLQQYVSEATFLRSLTYFYLVRIWKDVPLVLEPTESDNADLYLSLSSSELVLEQIKNDLIAIALKTPAEYPSVQESKCRATAGAVNALLADISLWSFEYQDCIKYATAVEESERYFLLSSTDWFMNFQPGTSLESIFEIYYDQTEKNRLYKLVYSENQFEASEYANEILNDNSLLADEQIRANGSISRSNRVWKYAGYYPDGYTGRSSSYSQSANYIIYRYADICLMKAEALSQLDRFDEAEAYINLVRVRAELDELDITGTRKSFEDAILEERAKEFAFEGKRWFDLLRMGRRDNYARKDELIEILVRNVASTQKLVQQAKLSNPLGWYMPIHQDEIDRNKNISQNAYYYEAE